MRAHLAQERLASGPACTSGRHACPRRPLRVAKHNRGLPPCRVLAEPVRTVEAPVMAQTMNPGASPASLLAEIVAPVATDMEQMNRNLRNVVGSRHPMLVAAADQIFGAGGKKLRPMVVFLVARATAELAGMRCGAEGRGAGRHCMVVDAPPILACPAAGQAAGRPHVASALHLCMRVPNTAQCPLLRTVCACMHSRPATRLAGHFVATHLGCPHARVPLASLWSAATSPRSSAAWQRSRR